jgi:hypothetical protein
VSVMPKVIYDKLNHDSLVPTSMHLQLADQLIQCPTGIAKDIPVKIKSSYVPCGFCGAQDGCLSSNSTHSREAIPQQRRSHD